jgi:apolipoprotein D and lipocalin family protein
MKIHTLPALVIGTLLMGCSPKYEKTVAHVDRDKFMRRWHVQAGRFTSFEKDPYNSVESYTWNEKEERIDVDFTFNQGSFDGPLKKIPQKAWIENKETNAHWKVQPFWPLKFNYLIIALDPNYEWTAIGVPDQKYLWIMTKDAQFSKDKLAPIISHLDGLGYSTKDLEYVQHNRD